MRSKVPLFCLLLLLGLSTYLASPGHGCAAFSIRVSSTDHGPVPQGRLVRESGLIESDVESKSADHAALPEEVVETVWETEVIDPVTLEKRTLPAIKETLPTRKSGTLPNGRETEDIDTLAPVTWTHHRAAALRPQRPVNENAVQAPLRLQIMDGQAVTLHPILSSLPTLPPQNQSRTHKNMSHAKQLFGLPNSKSQKHAGFVSMLDILYEGNLTAAKQDVQKVFAEHDRNGDGYWDMEEAMQIVMARFGLQEMAVPANKQSMSKLVTQQQEKNNYYKTAFSRESIWAPFTFFLKRRAPVSRLNATSDVSSTFASLFRDMQTTLASQIRPIAALQVAERRNQTAPRYRKGSKSSAAHVVEARMRMNQATLSAMLLPLLSHKFYYNDERCEATARTIAQHHTTLSENERKEAQRRLHACFMRWSAVGEYLIEDCIAEMAATDIRPCLANPRYHLDKATLPTSKREALLNFLVGLRDRFVNATTPRLQKRDTNLLAQKGQPRLRKRAFDPSTFFDHTYFDHDAAAEVFGEENIIIAAAISAALLIGVPLASLFSTFHVANHAYIAKMDSQALKKHLLASNQIDYVFADPSQVAVKKACDYEIFPSSTTVSYWQWFRRGKVSEQTCPHPAMLINSDVLRTHRHRAEEADLSARITSRGELQPMCILQRSKKGQLIQMDTVMDAETKKEVPLLYHNCDFIFSDKAPALD